MADVRSGGSPAPFRIAGLLRRSAARLPPRSVVGLGAPASAGGRGTGAGFGRPTAGAASRWRERRSASHDVRAVRAPAARRLAPRAMSSVTTRVPSGSATGEIHQQDVGRAAPGVADHDPGREATVHAARRRRAVEHQRHRDPGRHQGPEASRDRDGGQRPALPGEGVQQVRAVDEEPGGADEGVCGGTGHGEMVRPLRPRYDSRHASPCRPRRRRVPRRRPDPGRRGRAGGSRRSWRRRRLRDEQLDALPRRLRDAALGDGRSRHRRPRGQLGAGDRALPGRPAPGPAGAKGAGRGRRRAGARVP